MFEINAVRERMDVVMKTALRFVEALSAAEDHVGELEQFGFALFRAGRREFEGRRLIHAIVDNKKRIETPGEGHRRWRVVPEDVIADLVFQEEFFEQEPLFYRGRFGVIRPLAQTRRHDKYSAIAPPDVQPRNRRAEDRFLYEENAPFAGRPAHQVLWSPAREIPSQARKANYVRRIISPSFQPRLLVLFCAVAFDCSVIHNLNLSNECASIVPLRSRPQGRRAVVMEIFKRRR